jgi:hypothetical protein
MLLHIKEILARFLEHLRKPMEITEGFARPAESLKFGFRYGDVLYDVTVYCNERIYLCTYDGFLRFERKFPIYEVYSVIGGLELDHEIKHVFDMTIFFPAIGNLFCSSRQHALYAIDAYISVITQRFKTFIDENRTAA